VRIAGAGRAQCHASARPGPDPLLCAEVPLRAPGRGLPMRGNENSVSSGSSAARPLLVSDVAGVSARTSDAFAPERSRNSGTLNPPMASTRRDRSRGRVCGRQNRRLESPATPRSGTSVEDRVRRASCVVRCEREPQRAADCRHDSVSLRDALWAALGTAALRRR
jgi:hypothetical protein